MKPYRLLTTLTLALWGLAAQAVPITYISEGIGSGTVGNVTFTDVAFRFTSKADTNDLIPLSSSIFVIPNLLTTVVLDGIGAFDFATPTLTHLNTLFNGVGLSRNDGGPLGQVDFINRADPVFAGWDLVSNFGPVITAVFTTQFNPPYLPVLLSNGEQITFAEGGESRGIFQAIVATDVPEPAGISLAGLALVIALKGRRARRA